MIVGTRNIAQFTTLSRGVGSVVVVHKSIAHGAKLVAWIPAKNVVYGIALNMQFVLKNMNVKRQRVSVVVRSSCGGI